MEPSRDSLSASEVERQLYEAAQFVDGLFPQSEDEIKELQSMFGTTPITLPESLREPNAVLKRIIDAEDEQKEPTEFGCLITMLRTEKKLSVEQLATKVALSPETISSIESDPNTVATPFAATALAEYFQLQPQSVIRLAGLTRESSTNSCEPALSVAACAKPNFESLTRAEKDLFHQLVKRLRKKA